MAGMVAPKPDPKQQLEPAHPIAPMSANQTSATTRHYADGTSDVVQGGLNRAGVPYMVPAHPVLSVGPFQPGNILNPDIYNDAGVIGQAVHGLVGSGTPVTSQRFAPPAMPAPPVMTHGPNFGQPVATPVTVAPPAAPTGLPVSTQQAHGWLDYLLGGASARAAPPATPADPTVTVSRGGVASAPISVPAYQGASVARAVGPQAATDNAGPNQFDVGLVGAPQQVAQGQQPQTFHDMGYHPKQSWEDFQRMTAGMSGPQFYRMLGATHYRNVQEQAAGQMLANSLALPDASKMTADQIAEYNARQEFLRNLALSGTVLPGGMPPGAIRNDQ